MWWLAACAVPEPSVEAVPVAPIEVEPSPEPVPAGLPEACRVFPPAETTCWGELGGMYGEGACGPAGQCCAGSWTGEGTCGSCTCADPSGREGCATAGETRCAPAFDGTSAPLDDGTRAAMTGVSWREGCPVGLDDLAVLDAPIWGFDGQPSRGRLIVRADLGPAFLDVLGHAWAVRFPIERMEPVDDFGGSDEASMAANNTSAFNCRAITGGTSYSEHSFGHAIDLNPRQNPYVKGERVLPPEGRAFLERDPGIPGLIADPGPIVGAFRRHGFRWGGAWESRKDYQHFSENGR